MIEKSFKWTFSNIKKYIWGVFIGAMLTTALLLISLGILIEESTGLIQFIIMIIFATVYCITNVGYTDYLVQAYNGKKEHINILFSRFQDEELDEIIKTFFLKIVYISIFSLMFIIPGIVKMFSYALVDYINADKDYLDQNATERLRLSEKMMSGYKAELFKIILIFAFIHIFSILYTYGIAEIIILPIQKLVISHFLITAKQNYERIHKENYLKFKKNLKKTS